MYQIWTKKIGLHFGRFFTKASGHLEPKSKNGNGLEKLVHWHMHTMSQNWPALYRCSVQNCARSSDGICTYIRQGDQIGRISAALWVIAYFGQLIENYRSIPHLYLGYFIQWISFSIIFDKNWVGLHFWRFFHKLIWSP
jgi:hypothetical protein